MAEGIITRGSTPIPDEVLNPLNPTAGYHAIRVTLIGPEGDRIQNWPLNCKDGSTWYNYTTNEKGQCDFMVNSGAANISFFNDINGVQYLDVNAQEINIDAPVGGVTRKNMEIQRGNNFYEFLTNKNFGFVHSQDCELILVGGGGGGGGAKRGSDEESYFGGGGGAGYMNQYNNQLLNRSNIYEFIIGKGGIGGKNNNGTTGGTSYIKNTEYSAIGGGYGSESSSYASKAGIGGLGNGGGGNQSSEYILAENSPVDFAGGGGAGAWYRNINCKMPGSPYGGGVNDNSIYVLDVHGLNGSRGGGGGGSASSGSTTYGGRGGNGLMRINIFYK